jgi:hypothetical protein
MNPVHKLQPHFAKIYLILFSQIRLCLPNGICKSSMHLNLTLLDLCIND